MSVTIAVYHGDAHLYEADDRHDPLQGDVVSDEDGEDPEDRFSYGIRHLKSLWQI